MHTSLLPEGIYHKLVAENPHAVIFITDLDTRTIRWCNDTMEKLLGYSPAEMRAMGAGLFKHIMHPDDHPDALKAGELFLSGQQEYTACFRFKKKGAAAWQWLHGTTFRVDPGKKESAGTLLCIARVMGQTDTPEKAALAFKELYLNRHRPAGMDFSHRQLDILRLLKKGYHQDEIGKELLMGYETVRSDLKKLYEQFEVHNAAALVARIMELYPGIL